MNGRLFGQAVSKFFGGLLLTALLLFPAAGTLRWPRAWLLLALLFVPMFAAGLALLAKNPALLKKRLNAREEQPAQRCAIAFSAAMFAAMFTLAGLGVRFGWPALPGWASGAASAAFLAGYALYAETLRENAWLSRTVEVQDGQRVVDTGLYGVVRHPMYLSTLLLFLSMPLILGSLPAFGVALLYVPIIAGRIRNEEAVLEAGLAGYADYKRRVRWRLIPHIW